MTRTFTTPDGSIRLLCQDAAEFLRAQPDKSVDLVVTSPPYNKGKRDQKSYGLRARRQSDSNTVKWAAIGYEDAKPELEYELFLQAIVCEALRVSRGVVAINHQIVGRDRYARHPLFLLQPFRDKFWSEVIWDRRGSMQFNARKHALSHESVYVFGKPHWWNQREASRLTVWNISPRRSAAHACAWPHELPMRLIDAYCPPDGLVLDPFMGIATAGVAAYELGRRFIGCDSDPRTFEQARRQASRATERYALFGNEVVCLPMTIAPQRTQLELVA